MKSILLITLMIFSLGLSSCKKDLTKQLTQDTQIGANTFSCLIDKYVFTAAQDLFAPKRITLNYSTGATPYFSLSGNNSYASSPYRSVNFSINGNIKQGTYPLGDVNVARINARNPEDVLAPMQILQVKLYLRG